MSDRDDARALLRELLPELLQEALASGTGNGTGTGNGSGTGNGNGTGRHAQADAAPSVPAPPVAAVLRPSTWARPPAPGEVIGDGASPQGGRTEHVTLASDDDLDRFVRALLDRFERDGAAIRAGRLRFSLGRPGAAAGTLRIERGAVTERTVKDAAAAGTRLVLAPGAVLTPLAREKARALGLEIERERRC
jgi:hypothetical protein